MTCEYRFVLDCLNNGNSPRIDSLAQAGFTIHSVIAIGAGAQFLVTMVRQTGYSGPATGVKTII